MPGLHFLKVTAMVVGTCLTVAALSGAAFERVSRDHDARKFPPAGRVVEVGGRKVQIDCRGSGSPTVVLESGLDNNGSLAWVTVHDSIAATTRTCAWSRPGIMWSDPTGRDFDADSNAITLHAALLAAGESAPWIMVGHSIGGPYVLTFASLYADEVKGFVMVDVSHPDQFARFEQAVGKSIMPSATVPRLGAALAWTGLMRLIPRPPNPATWPAVLDEAPPSFMSRSINGLARELAAIPNTLEREGRAKSLGDKPLVVLSAGNRQGAAELAMMGLSTEQGERLYAAHAALAADMASWSTRGRLEVVEGASHYIQMDRPHAVIAAVNDVVRRVAK